MRYLFVTSACLLVTACLAVLPAAAQTEPESAPRTSWGQPDLGGVWEFKTRTPLERPERYGDREFLTEEQAAEIEERERSRLRAMEERPAQRTIAIPTAGDRPGRWLDSPDHPSLQGQTGSYNIFWFDGRGYWENDTLLVETVNFNDALGAGEIVDRQPAPVHGDRSGHLRAAMGSRSSFSDTVGTSASHGIENILAGNRRAEADAAGR